MNHKNNINSNIIITNNNACINIRNTNNINYNNSNVNNNITY